MGSNIKKLDEKDSAPLRLAFPSGGLYCTAPIRSHTCLDGSRRLELMSMEPALRLSSWDFAYCFPIPTHRLEY